MSMLQSHLPPHYLGVGVLSYPKEANWSWDLDLVISIGDELQIPFRLWTWWLLDWKVVSCVAV